MNFTGLYNVKKYKNLCFYIYESLKEIPNFGSKKELFLWVKNIFNNLGEVTIKETGITLKLSNSSANRETMKRRSSYTHNKAVFYDFKNVVETATKLKDRTSDSRHTHNQEVYLNKISLDGEVYTVEIFCDYLEPNREYRYACHNAKKAPSSRESSSTSSIGAINIIKDTQENFNSNVKHCEGAYMKEDLTFFFFF